jgi:hypothetical protein
MKTKEQILEENGYIMLEGYMFDYERPENPKLTCILVTKDEIEEMLRGTPGKFFWMEDDEQCYSLDDAWDDFSDNYCCDNDLDLTDDELIKRLS